MGESMIQQDKERPQAEVTLLPIRRNRTTHVVQGENINFAQRLDDPPLAASVAPVGVPEP